MDGLDRDGNAETMKQIHQKNESSDPKVSSTKQCFGDETYYGSQFQDSSPNNRKEDIFLLNQIREGDVREKSSQLADQQERINRHPSFNLPRGDEQIILDEESSVESEKY